MDVTHLFGLKVRYCLYPEELTEVQIREVEEHIKSCARCRLEVENTKLRADFLGDKKNHVIKRRVIGRKFLMRRS